MALLLAVLVAFCLACGGIGKKSSNFHRICAGSMQPSEDFLAVSDDKGPLEIGEQVTSSKYWFQKDGKLQHDEQVELITPANGDGVDTVIKLCRPWEGKCASCPAIAAFDDNATIVVDNKFIYSKLPTLDWLRIVSSYTDEDLHVTPGRPESNYRICVRSFWAWVDPDFCAENGLEADCEGWFRATCRKAPLPDGGPNGFSISEGDADPVNGGPSDISGDGGEEKTVDASTAIEGAEALVEGGSTDYPGDEGQEVPVNGGAK